jgi:hypothetical protein
VQLTYRHRLGGIFGYGGPKGVLPGPGAKSGHSFVTGGMLGMQGDSVCNGILSQEFEATKKIYHKMQKRWKDMAGEFERHAASASSADEAKFWRLLAARLLTWSQDDHFRVQFRMCEFSKIGGTVCRHAGRKRKRAQATEETAEAAEVDAEGAVAEVDADRVEPPEIDAGSDDAKYASLQRSLDRKESEFAGS